jgi:proliferating cell nuclear antigen
MFEAILSEALLLKKIIDSIKDLVTDVNIDATPSGLSVQAMDSSHVALVSLTLGQNGFESYRADRPMTLGVSISNLSKVLKLAGNEDRIILRADEDATSLNIIFDNKRQEKKTEFTLNLITLDSEHLGIPETNYTSEITMNSLDFTKLCRELHQLSETVTIEASTTHVKFSIDGEVGSGTIEIKTQEGKDSGKDQVCLSFALRYLNMFNKASTLCNHVKLMLAPETPLVVEYEIEHLGALKYYLAPKINEDA